MDLINNLYDSFFASKFFSVCKTSFYVLVLFFCFVAAVVIIDFTIVYIKYKIKYKKPVDDFTRVYKEDSLLKLLFVSFPRAFWHDYFTKDPNIFGYYNTWLICGDQGTGKTISACYLIRKMKYEYPALKVRTNFDCKGALNDLYDVDSLMNSGNGIYGELDVIDEIQTWFSSLNSKNFPPEMLSIISQQRHVRRCIIGISQRFHRIGKPLREQCAYLCRPTTFFGCLTRLKITMPELDQDGQIIKETKYKTFWFVHDQELRNMYDSYSNIDFGLCRPSGNSSVAAEALPVGEPVPDPVPDSQQNKEKNKSKILFFGKKS